MTDIVDRIDQLVDEQLAGGEPRIGFNYGDPQFPDCPHCDRKWHGIAITVRVAEMYDLGHYDNDYRVDTDESPVLCRGSDFIGPMPMEAGYIDSVISRFSDHVNSIALSGLWDAMEELPTILRPLAEFARTFQLDPRLEPWPGLDIQGSASYSVTTSEGFVVTGHLEE